MEKYKDRVLQEDNLVYSFFGDYNIVISKETGYEWMGKSLTDLFYVMLEKDRGADQEQLLHLRVFTTIGLTIKYLHAILPDYVFDEMLIKSIVNASNSLALQHVSKG